PWRAAGDPRGRPAAAARRSSGVPVAPLRDLDGIVARVTPDVHAAVLHDPIAAGGLGLVERLVGVEDEVVAGGPVHREVRDAAADGEAAERLRLPPGEIPARAGRTG